MQPGQSKGSGHPATAHSTPASASPGPSSAMWRSRPHPTRQQGQRARRELPRSLPARPAAPHLRVARALCRRPLSAFNRARDRSSQQRRTCWNQTTSGRRQPDAGDQHQREMREHRQIGRAAPARSGPYLAERTSVSRSSSAPNASSRPATSTHGQQRLPGEGRGDHQELAGEHAERRQPGDGGDAGDQGPAEHRMAVGQAADVGDALQCPSPGRRGRRRRRSPTWSGCAWSSAAARRSCRAARPCRRRRR